MPGHVMQDRQFADQPPAIGNGRLKNVENPFSHGFLIDSAHRPASDDSFPFAPGAYVGPAVKVLKALPSAHRTEFPLGDRVDVFEVKLRIYEKDRVVHDTEYASQQVGLYLPSRCPSFSGYGCRRRTQRPLPRVTSDRGFRLHRFPPCLMDSRIFSESAIGFHLPS